MPVKVACGNRTASSIVARNEVSACFTHWPYLLFLVFALLGLYLKSNQPTKPAEQKKKMKNVCETQES
jgi:hypothetical protein